MTVSVTCTSCNDNTGPRAVTHMHVVFSLLQIGVWDTAGVERFRTLTRNYYRNADAAVYVYSVTDTASLHYLSQWLKDTEQHAPHALRVMVGNKIDLESSVEVEESVAQAFANLNDIQHVYRISCKTNTGIKELIESVSKAVHQRTSPLGSETGQQDIVTVSSTEKKEGGCAC